ncbi:hypothetical protein GCM10020255_053070 [Rhodococcus baikonurensis]
MQPSVKVKAKLSIRPIEIDGGQEMHVYISVDMEGIAGIATLDQTIRGGGGYHRAQMLMTAETNAAIAGAFDAGATSVLVNDSHGTMDNLLHADLDPRARLIFGTPKMQCMAEGLTSDHDVALFVGYHAPAGGPAFWRTRSRACSPTSASTVSPSPRPTSTPSMPPRRAFPSGW